jgi:hypothetical protein
MQLLQDISKNNIELRLSRDNGTVNRKEKYENNASISTKRNMNRQVITSLLFLALSLALKAQRSGRSLNAMQSKVFRFPDGCWVEGDHFKQMNYWKKQLGTSIHVPPHGISGDIMRAVV